MADVINGRRNVSNYKRMHMETARKKGCLDAFIAAKTYTQCRKILFGVKEK